LNAALLGRYDVEREVGRGGMATVYLARDLRHSRRVALKVLHSDLAAALGAERFLAEITTTANLQHPHILPLHDSGSANGFLFYVMPFVEGETLRARLTREALLPVDDAVRLAREVLSALDYAHRHGVVHRDIKPENILLHDGSALVADFGISLAVSSASGPRMTQTGLSLGTPSYMSPEQAMGDRVIDGRADIYAVGAMLYEMLIGEPPYTGPTSQAIVARLLTEEPRSLVTQRKLVPPNVDAAVRRALQKLPADRFASAAEMSSALVRAEYSIDLGTATVPIASSSRATRLRTALLTAGALAAGIVGTLVAMKMREREPVPDPPTRFSIDAPTLDANLAGVAVSPDGSRIAFTRTDSGGRTTLLLRSMDSETPVLVPGSTNVSRPSFSPNGRQIGFVQDGSIKRVSLDGGAMSTVLTAFAGPWAWLDDETIVVMERIVRRVSVDGGVVDTIAKLDSAAGFFVGVDALASGKGLVVAMARNTRSAPQLLCFSMESGELTPLGISGSAPVVVNDGFLLYTDATGTLFSVPFDADRGRVTGKPVTLASGIRATFRAQVAASRGGTVVYRPAPDMSGGELVTVNRSGLAVRIPAAAGAYRAPRFSPEGRRLVFTILRGDGTNNGDVWTYDFESERLNRLTFDGFAISPSWTSDGRAVLFTRREPEKQVSVYRVQADGSATAQPYFTSPAGNPYETVFTPDGRNVVFRVDTRTNRRDVLIAPIDSPTVARALLGSPFDENMLAVSPDGRWLAYVSDASGRQEVYLRRIDGVSGVWPVSRNGGKEPRWGGSMRELLYRHGDSVFAVPLVLGEGARAGQPRAMFAGNYATAPADTYWDASPDGNRFVFVREDKRAPERLVVLMNTIPRKR
jgi:eukaryotic-like serine/threonine-protein kinase